MKNIRKLLQAVSISVLLALTGCMSVNAGIPAGEIRIAEKTKHAKTVPTPSSQADIRLSEIPAYSGDPYVVIHDNKPYFKKSDLTKKSYEYYSKLDSLNRCGPAIASISTNLMPTKKRESIGMIRPSGWHTVKYDDIEGKYLYNRCHLIGYQLTAENANAKNLITGTRYMNTEGMEPFENMTADYIKETKNHVLYRVTPLFQGNNLVANGVLMEAESVEDQGKGLEFCVYCYNVQPDVIIHYADGTSHASSSTTKFTSSPTVQPSSKTTGPADHYIGNRNSKVFHHSWCTSVNQMKDNNKVTFENRDDAIRQGYRPCKRCNP